MLKNIQPALPHPLRSRRRKMSPNTQINIQMTNTQNAAHMMKPITSRNVVRNKGIHDEILEASARCFIASNSAWVIAPDAKLLRLFDF